MNSFKLFFLFLLGTLHFNLSAQTNPNFYLHTNGVTCMCPKAAVGETGTVNGVTYTKRTREQITEENASTTCTSGITDMSYLFYAKYIYEPIGHWDTSSVIDMSYMFTHANQFNQPIGNWDVSNVKNMSYMFGSLAAFNHSLSEWNTSNVKNMSFMFYFNLSFNQPIENWDVSNVNNMSFMFQGSIFNQPIENWNVGNVTDMSGMFAAYNSTSFFNQPIGNWNVSNVENMTSMFSSSYHFNQPIGNWNVGKVTKMSEMFNNTKIFNQDLSKWCAKSIDSEPRLFSNNSTLLPSYKPKWGAECTTLSSSEFTNVITQLTISPNPFTNTVKINLPENTQANQIQVLNAVGQTVYTSDEKELDLAHLPTGMYFVKVNTNQGNATEKIIKN